MYGTLFVYAGPTGAGKTQDAASCFLDSSVVSLSAIHREAYGSPVVDRQHKDAVTRRAFKKLFALLERGLDAVSIAPNCSRMSRAHLYREVKSRFPGVRVVVVLVHVPLADILKRSSGVSASLVRDEYLALQIPRVGVDCDTFSVQAPEFSAYLPEVNQSYLAPHNSPYHVESIAEHVAYAAINHSRLTALSYTARLFRVHLDNEAGSRVSDVAVATARNTVNASVTHVHL